MKSNKRNKISLNFIFLVILGLACAAQAQAQLQDVVDTSETQQVIVYRGDVVALKVFSLTQLAVTVPGVVDLGKVDPDEIQLIGQHEGETTLFIWDEKGKRKINVSVATADMDDEIRRIGKLLKEAQVDGIILRKNLEERKIIVSGKVPKSKRENYQRILAPFSKDILDFTVEGEKLIQIDVQITELTTTLAKTMGVQWSPTSFTFTETIPASSGHFEDLFKIGQFARTPAIIATVNFLLSEGKARVLSKPSLIVTEGEAATILVGGEIPVRSTTTSEGAVSENISYKSYGVDFSVTPTIRNDKISIDLNVSVRDVDASNAVGGDTAFTTRSASTKLLLDDKQTIILAGLIKSNKGEQVNRVPFLSKIPIAGLLFRNKNWTPNKEEELVISLTPTIIEEEEPNPAEVTNKATEEAPAAQEAEKDNVKNEGVEAASEGKVEPAVESEESTGPQEAEENAEAEKGAGETGSGPAIEKDVETKLDSIVNEESETAPEAALEDYLAETPPETTAEPEKAREEIGAGSENISPAAEDIKFSEIETGGPGGAKKTGWEDVPLTEGDTPQAQDISNAITAYVQAIQKKISRAISFPYDASEKGWDGTVKLALVVLSDGSLLEVSVQESSGHDIFDNDAVSTTKLAAPFEPFPPTIPLEEIRITLPIVYSQEAVLEDVSKTQTP